MSTVGILYICTGAYTVFWKEFYETYEKHFLPKTEKHYIVFTDSDSLLYAEKANVHKIRQERLGWPYDTLMRFEIFLKHKEEISCYDYLFFMNANCICKNIVYEKDFLPLDRELLVVKHPGYYNKSNIDFTYDRNEKSEAYIPEGEGSVYVCGGVNGGKTKVFLRLIEDLQQMVKTDLDRNIIPLWHDESILNKYVYIHPEMFCIKQPEYCFPEGWDIPFTEKIVVRDKSKYINVNKIKKTREYKIIKLCRLIKKRIVKKCHEND